MQQTIIQKIRDISHEIDDIILSRLRDHIKNRELDNNSK